MWVLPPTNQPIQSIHHTSLLIMVSISQLCTFPKCSYFYECECVELSVVFQNAHILNDCGCVELSALSEIEICDLIFLLYFFDLSYMNLFCTPYETYWILSLSRRSYVNCLKSFWYFFGIFVVFFSR